MANLTSVGITNGVPTSGTGTVSTIDNLMAQIAAALPLPTGAATSALQSSIVTALAAPLAAGSNIIGAANSVGASVEVIPAVTAGAYTAGFVIGGIMTFANVLAPTTFSGLLSSLSLKFKGSVQAGSFAVAIFKTSPAGTFADHGAPAIAAADTAALVDVYSLTSAQSPLGTHTIYSLNGIGKQIVGASTSLFAVVIAVTAPANPASTSDMSLDIGVVQ